MPLNERIRHVCYKHTKGFTSRFVFDKCWCWNGLQASHRLHAFSLKGVAKRILHLRIKVPLNIRIGPRAVDEISTALKGLKACILCEFDRKHRSLVEVDRWKTTEFRQFF